MASKLSIVFVLAFVACIYAAPATKPEENAEATTQGEDVLLIEELELKEVPVVVAVIEPTSSSEVDDKGTTGQPEHKLEKRSLRGDNPSHDLLANQDGIQFDNGAFDLDGRRIKFLPTWVG